MPLRQHRHLRPAGVEARGRPGARAARRSSWPPLPAATGPPTARMLNERSASVGSKAHGMPCSRAVGATTTGPSGSSRTASPSKVCCSRLPRSPGSYGRPRAARRSANCGQLAQLQRLLRRARRPAAVPGLRSPRSRAARRRRRPAPPAPSRRPRPPAARRPAAGRRGPPCRRAGGARPARRAQAADAPPRAARSAHPRSAPPPAGDRCRAARPDRSAPRRPGSQAAARVPSPATARSSAAGCGHRRWPRVAVRPLPARARASVASARSSELPRVCRCSSRASSPRRHAGALPRRSPSDSLGEGTGQPGCCPHQGARPIAVRLGWSQ